jgi:hypothetical protein
MLPNMRTPNVGSMVAPNSFGNAAPAAPAAPAGPIATPADRAYGAANRVADAQLRSGLPTIDNTMTPADRAYFAGWNQPAAAAPAAAAPAAPASAALPPHVPQSQYVPPAADPNFTMMTRGMSTPDLASNVSPRAYGGGTPVAATPAAPAAPTAPAAPDRFLAAQRAADQDLFGSAPGPVGPPGPSQLAAQVQARGDRAAIMDNVVNPTMSGLNHLGAAGLDLATAVPRAGAGVINTVLRVPNAFGAGIPYIPDTDHMISSLTPFSDQLNASEAKAAQPAAAPAATPAPAAASAAAPAAPTYTPERLARAGVGADGGQIAPALADRLANPAPVAAPAAAGYAMPAGMRDPYAAINAGFAAQGQRANAFMDRALSYINDGGDIFDRATRGRAIGSILQSVMGPNNQGSVMGQGADAFNNAVAGMTNANTYANASMHGADSGLIGQLAATGERASEFAQTPITTGAEPNPMGAYYPNLQSYGLPGGVSRGQAQPPRPVGGAATRQEAAKPREGQTGNYQGRPVVVRNGKWEYVNATN